jgi:hypothetical protein
VAVAWLMLLQVHAPRDRNRLDYKGLVFYYDNIHPDGVTGHRSAKRSDTGQDQPVTNNELINQCYIFNNEIYR